MKLFQMKSLCSFNKDCGLLIWKILKLLVFFQNNSSGNKRISFYMMPTNSYGMSILIQNRNK